MKNMLAQNDVLELLISQKNDENALRVEQVIDRLQDMSEEEFAKLLQGKNINTIDDAKSLLESMLMQNKFEPLNELVSYGVSDNAIHMHVVPKDAREYLTVEGRKKAELLLIDAVEKIKKICAENEKYKNVDTIYAVSDIVRGPISKWYEGLGFDTKYLPIEEAKEDNELKYFYEMFKDKKGLGRAKITIDKIMSDEWETKKNTRKAKLGQKTVGNKVLDGLSKMVKPKEEIPPIEDTPHKKEIKPNVLEQS